MVKCVRCKTGFRTSLSDVQFLCDKCRKEMTGNAPTTKLRVEIADPCYFCSPIIIEGKEFLPNIIICTDCLKHLRNYIAERKEMDEINEARKQADKEFLSET